MACAHGDLLSELPDRSDDPDLESTNGELTLFLLNAEIVAQPPAVLRTDAIRVHRGAHDWFGYKVDAFQFCFDKPACRALGLLILGVVFHPEPEAVEIHLTDPASEMKVLRLEYRHELPEDTTGSYWRSPSHLQYEPFRPVPPNPFQSVPASALPVLRLDMCDDQTGVGFGDDLGSVNLAALLLALGQSDNIFNEFHLEGEAAQGGRGVGVASAELVLRLPGPRTNFWGPTEQPPELINKDPLDWPQGGWPYSG